MGKGLKKGRKIVFIFWRKIKVFI